MSAKERILVVDDEPSIRKYLQTLLEVEGFDVEAVSNGKDAIRRVSEGASRLCNSRRADAGDGGP
jgi:CheY-like chemotaxis protein